MRSFPCACSICPLHPIGMPIPALSIDIRPGTLITNRRLPCSIKMQDRPLDGEQRIAKTKASGDIDNIDVSDLAGVGFGDHDSYRWVSYHFAGTFFSSITITSIGLSPWLASACRFFPSSNESQ